MICVSHKLLIQFFRMIFISGKNDGCSSRLHTGCYILNNLIVPNVMIADNLIRFIGMHPFAIRPPWHNRARKPWINKMCDSLRFRLILRRILVADRSQQHIVDFFQSVRTHRRRRYSINIFSRRPP